MKWELYNALAALLELAKNEAPPGDVREWATKTRRELVALVLNPDYDPDEENFGRME